MAKGFMTRRGLTSDVAPFQGKYTSSELTLLGNVPIGAYVYSNEEVAVGDGVNYIPQWTKVTEMNVLPENDGWSKVGNTSATVSNGILNITTASTQDCYYTIASGGITASPTKVVEVRLRVNSVGANNSTFPGHDIFIADGVRWAKLYVTTTNIYYTRASDAIPVSMGAVDLQTGFKTIRIEFNNSVGLKVFVDGTQLGSTIGYTSLFASSVNQISFGDGHSTTSRENANVDYDYFKYQLDLESNPDLLMGQIIPSVGSATSELELQVTDGGALKSYGTTVKRYSGFVSKSPIGTW